VFPRELLPETPSSFEIPVTLCELENWAYKDGGGGGIRLMATLFIYC